MCSLSTGLVVSEWHLRVVPHVLDVLGTSMLHESFRVDCAVREPHKAAQRLFCQPVNWTTGPILV